MADRRATDDHDLPGSRPPRGMRRIGRWRVEDLAGLTPLRHGVRDTVVAQRTGPGVARRRADEVALLVSELATNALRHGGAPAVVDLRTDGASFVLDVADHDVASRPVLSGARAPGDGGFGLMIARRLADDVGWYVSGRTKHVWALVTPR